MGPAYDAVSLDVGGVLVVPDHDVLAAVLDDVAVAYDRSRFGRGHYLAMAAVDRAASDPEDFTDYLWGFVRSVGVPEADQARAHAALLPALVTPVWRRPVDGSREGLAALAERSTRLGVTSNSDGTVADLLVAEGWLQAGPGPLVAVEVVIDSGLVGAAKPDPRVFAATLAVFDLPPGRVLHVGDSVHYDVDGARASGLQAVHFDPFACCPATDHPHLRRLTDLLLPPVVASQ